MGHPARPPGGGGAAPRTLDPGQDCLVAMTTGGQEARQFPRVHSRGQRPGTQAVTRTGHSRCTAAATSCPRVRDSPYSPARARCGRPQGPRSSAPACCWRWWPAQTRWWGQRMGLREKSSGENKLKTQSGPYSGRTGGEWDLGKEAWHTVLKYSASLP